MPALLTSTSRPPSSAIQRTTACFPIGFEADVMADRRDPAHPFAFSRLASARTRSPLRSVSITAAPDSANARARTRPMPRAAPVTITTLPANPIFMRKRPPGDPLFGRGLVFAGRMRDYCRWATIFSLLAPSEPRMPSTPYIRIRSLTGYMELVRELGADPLPLLKRCNISPERIEKGDDVVPHASPTSGCSRSPPRRSGARISACGIARRQDRRTCWGRSPSSAATRRRCARRCSA